MPGPYKHLSPRTGRSTRVGVGHMPDPIYPQIRVKELLGLFKVFYTEPQCSLFT